MAAWQRIAALFSLLRLGLLLLLLSPRSSGIPLDTCPGDRSCQPRKPPVVIIPGDLGNQLEAKLDKPSVVHYICYKKTDSFFTLWLNMELLVPVAIDCWVDNIRLIYNKTTHSSSSPPGVDIRVPGFGKTYSVEYLDPSKRSVGMYFFTIVQALVEWGYTRDNDIRAAPYDWRKAPNENKEYFLALQKLIEEMAENAGEPVVLIAHSMGNLYTLYFLNQQPQAWKDRYIKSFISLGPPWAGVAKTLRVIISGDNNHIPVISSLKIRFQQRSASTTSWLLPYAQFWPKDQVLVRTPTTNYTVLDYERLYSDINFKEGWLMRQDTMPLVADLTPPGVAVHCMYGSGVATEEAFHYSDKFPDEEPLLVHGDGDGTVNLRSAIQCRRWVGKQKQPVTLMELPGNEHVNMLLNYTTVAYIKSVLFSP
ncbi:phospholipase A2 group XV [Cyclopterus lumpus]|uniref:Phospholipase A2, group XV n=1 Tax=Cyclopterus lumpus TaxID=8103 RepID=A0A8C2W6Y2_CYCLU|nr:phospholipase A2 group XV [Cyclopterus lumpus]XP_034390338.1 phospholipase A2 group XV [Cyclopterus lumpus]